MPEVSKAYKKEGGAPTFLVASIQVGSLVVPTTFIAECQLGGTELKVKLGN